MSRQDILNSPHVTASKLKRKRALLNKSLYFIGFLLVVFLSLGFLSRISKINIKGVVVEGNKVAETRAIESRVQEAISGNYLWLYPKKNLLFYSKENIEEKLHEEFKILDNISIKLQGDRNLLIGVTERTPSYTWCGEDLPKENEKIEIDDCYFMDNSGYVFAVAPYFSGDVYFRFFGQLVDGPEVLGSRFMPDNFSNLTAFISSLKQMGLRPASLVDRGEKFEIFLSSPSNPPNAPKIIVERNFEYAKVAENLQAALGTDPLKTNMDKKYSSLLYIDLSFGNKVYYKFR